MQKDVAEKAEPPHRRAIDAFPAGADRERAFGKFAARRKQRRDARRGAELAQNQRGEGELAIEEPVHDEDIVLGRAQNLAEALGAEPRKRAVARLRVAAFQPAAGGSRRLRGAHRAVARHDSEAEFVGERGGKRGEALVRAGRVVPGPIGAEEDEDRRTLVGTNGAAGRNGSKLDSVMVAQMRLERLHAVFADIGPRVLDLGVDQHPFPAALQEVKDEAGPSVEEAEAEYIAVDKVEHAAHIERRLAEDGVPEEALGAHPSRRRGLARRVGGKELVLQIDEIDHLPRGVAVLLLRPPGDVAQAVVGEVLVEGHALAVPQHRSDRSR